MDEREMQRTEVTDNRPLDFKCLRCGKEHRLWHNGGELDQKECCGLMYRLEAPRVDFVVYEGWRP